MIKMFKRLAMTLTAGLAFLMQPASSLADQRVALVIGNGD